MADLSRLNVGVSESIGPVSAVLMVPTKPKAILVLAHGAGAGMEHPFMGALAQELGVRSIATLRYNFPYMENGKKRPDVPAVAEKTVRRLLEEARGRCKAPLFAGGKSFGGRMTSQYLSKECLDDVRGIVFFGFPLHPAGVPGTERAKHLSLITIPMLFLQGTRDALAELKLLSKTVKGLPEASLKTFEGADHSFKVSKKPIIDLLALETSEWMDSILKRK